MRNSIELHRLNKVDPNRFYTPCELQSITNIWATCIRDAVRGGQMIGLKEPGHGKRFRFGFRYQIIGSDFIKWARETRTVLARQVNSPAPSQVAPSTNGINLAPIDPGMPIIRVNAARKKPFLTIDQLNELIDMEIKIRALKAKILEAA